MGIGGGTTALSDKSSGTHSSIHGGLGTEARLERVLESVDSEETWSSAASSLSEETWLWIDGENCGGGHQEGLFNFKVRGN